MRARKEFPKDSAWHSLKWSFREALELRALPPRPSVSLSVFRAERLSLFVVLSHTPLIAGHFI